MVAIVVLSYFSIFRTTTLPQSTRESRTRIWSSASTQVSPSCVCCLGSWWYAGLSHKNDLAKVFPRQAL